MDEIDREILISLLMEGGISQSEISKITGSSAQKINYRMKKMFEEGVIKNFRTHINPYFLNGMNLFVAYEGTNSIDMKGIGSIFRCLERTDFYELQARNEKELFDLADFMSIKFGNKIMQYRPKVPEMRNKINYYDLLILRELIKDPTINHLRLSQILGFRGSLIKKRINRMKSLRVFSIIPIIDLSKTDIFLFTIISGKRLEDKVNVNNTILKIIEDNTSIYVGIEKSMSNIRENLSKIRKIDSNAEVMVVYDYDFKPDFAEKAIKDSIEAEEVIMGKTKMQ
ncbi:MAG: winged helix-turn-helix transcriptional regulator [Thermoplasmata archaeon]